ncbi:regulatory protein [Jatrophihabitans endophyticus]|uniref:Regulatory protein RecX n=1 Tax=Jatrophihabitans endophyticus TaxID=1206085 RepID=A0A1M5LUX1_9ACTN|nr:regulatory protein RecX [Jatrophihabitans endophyticus]SHG68858.1 regulatory protein [Jatrophihabitans endophyticus]
MPRPVDPGRRAPTGATTEPPPEDEQQPPGDPEAVARIVCLRLLERRARSRTELEQAIAKRGVPGEVARVVLDRFTEVGLIDDAALAESMAGAQHRERGLARRAVAAKLRERGFGDDVVADATATIDAGQERERAEALVARRLRTLHGLPVEVQTRRLVGLLARKGYSSGVAYDVVREAVRAAAAGVDGDLDDGVERLFDASS